MIPENLLYTEEHEWLRVEDGAAVVGITDHAQEALGDITFVELPGVEAEVAKGDEVCVIESAKAAASVYAPVAGKILEVNNAIEDNPELVNSDPYGAGWIYKIRLLDEAELGSLMNAERYTEFEANADNAGGH